MEGLIFGGANIRWEICDTKPIGLAYSSKVNFKKKCVTVSFLPCFILYLKAISKYKAPGLYSEGRFNGGIFALRFWGAYSWRGLFSEFYGNSVVHRTICTLAQRHRKNGSIFKPIMITDSCISLTAKKQCRCAVALMHYNEYADHSNLCLKVAVVTSHSI